MDMGNVCHFKNGNGWFKKKSTIHIQQTLWQFYILYIFLYKFVEKWNCNGKHVEFYGEILLRNESEIEQKCENVEFFLSFKCNI